MSQVMAPYGSWKSPITSDLISSSTINFHHVTVDGPDTYWIEWRPSEGGRYCIVKRSADGTVSDVTPAGFNVRSTVHEYGGAAYTVANGTIYFSNYADQHLYMQVDNKPPQLFVADKGMRYADGAVDARRQRYVCVREDHTGAGPQAINSIVSIPLSGSGETITIASGNDFYANPRVSPDCGRIAWLTWSHPNMPWDGCELWTGTLNADGSVSERRLIAGGVAESICQPEWSPDGTLYFISDRSGWWNFYRVEDTQVEAVYPIEAEFGCPQWVFGNSTYAFVSPQQIICSCTRDGKWQLAILDPANAKLENIDSGFTDVAWLRAAGGRAVFKGGSPTEAACIVILDVRSRRCEIVRRSTTVSVDKGNISVPEAIEFPTEGGLTAHALFYRPRNKDFCAPDGCKPPLLVKSHGGPTGATTSTLNLAIQYWTSRGIAVLDVNYGGSTGFGRAYRERLNGNWGIVDVSDCVNGARHLVERGEVDGDRLIISGGSAGGYTTLCALTFKDTFKCGASYYGIGDLEGLNDDTHKFESRYNIGLIGPYPERRDIYLERSPIHHVEKLNCPVIFFQGLEDKVVPPIQSEMMVDALRAKGIPVAYLAFPGEQHGFRRAETVKRALDGELYFYSKILKFELADNVEPVEIENLKS